MVTFRHARHEAQLRDRAPNPVPFSELNFLPTVEDATPILKRIPGSASSSSPAATFSCGPHDNSGPCQKPTDSSTTQTLPIVLGVVIPITVAMVIFIVLHRRHVRKLRQEDATDRHKSLDFGMGTVDRSGPKRGKPGNKGIPEMSITETEKELRRGRGMSLDMDMGNPYVLPPGLQSSRGSLHSLSRAMNTGDDKYRPATTYIPNGDGYSSYPSTLRRSPVDDSSSYTGSGRSRVTAMDDSSQNLLRNASRMSRSTPPTQRNSPTLANSNPTSPAPTQLIMNHPAGLPSDSRTNGLRPGSRQVTRQSAISDVSNVNKDRASVSKGDNYRGASTRSGAAPMEPMSQPQVLEEKPSVMPDSPSRSVARKSPPAPINLLPSNPRPQVEAVQGEDKISHLARDDQNDFGTSFRVDPPSPELDTQNNSDNTDEHNSTPRDQNALGPKYEQDHDYDVRRLTMGVRPLPPEDPNDNAEQRANRIRSFYKEYFDDSKPGPVYSQDDYDEYYGGVEAYDGAIFDPIAGEYIHPSPAFAEPMARRAMTPPPRGPPVFQGQARHQVTMSGSNYMPPGPRAFSSASGRPGGQGPLPPKKKLPPPAPLPILPTPHLLNDDSMVLPMDFAPRGTAQQRRAGTPDSLRGGLRPYSPMVPVHQTLASAFDDLAVMPSPHALRRSGTFTALDFAPPPRFKNSESGSDAGSIRSNRSAMSATQLQNIRAGAYRLSRVPKEVVGTRDDLVSSLKPQWELR